MRRRDGGGPPACDWPSAPGALGPGNPPSPPRTTPYHPPWPQVRALGALGLAVGLCGRSAEQQASTGAPGRSMDRGKGLHGSTWAYMGLRRASGTAGPAHYSGKRQLGVTGAHGFGRGRVLMCCYCHRPQLAPNQGPAAGPARRAAKQKRSSKVQPAHPSRHPQQGKKKNTKIERKKPRRQGAKINMKNYHAQKPEKQKQEKKNYSYITPRTLPAVARAQSCCPVGEHRPPHEGATAVTHPLCREFYKKTTPRQRPEPGSSCNPLPQFSIHFFFSFVRLLLHGRPAYPSSVGASWLAQPGLPPPGRT